KGQYDLAAREFQIAINQLSDTEPVIYEMLGAAYEKAGNKREAMAAYENYLRLAPNGSLSPAVRSILDQLKTQQPDKIGWFTDNSSHTHKDKLCKQIFRS